MIFTLVVVLFVDFCGKFYLAILQYLGCLVTGGSSDEAISLIGRVALAEVNDLEMRERVCVCGCV